jgi:hypothetical protein
MSVLEYDAYTLIGLSATVPIAKTSRRTVFRECVVTKFLAREGLWVARDVHTREKHFFDLHDIVEGRVHLSDTRIEM